MCNELRNSRAAGPWCMKSWIGLSATGLVLLAMPGWVASEPRLASVQADSPTGGKQAASFVKSARAALAKGDAAVAVSNAEAATLLLPRDAETRALLGRAYLASGRFRSAETALGDALTLDPSLGRMAVTRALAQIALGQDEAALESLAAAEGRAPEADIGLALALLGRGDQARERLLSAVRKPGTDPRTRQNLAMAYALEGRWNDAAAVAAQDVPADKMADRLRRWAMIAQLKSDPAMQVGALLGVLPAADSGQPLALALVAAPPAPEAPVLVADAPTVSMPLPFVAPAAPAMQNPVSPAAPAPVAAAAATLPLQAEAPAAAPNQPVAKLAAPKAAALVYAQPRATVEGKWAVQLGAFYSVRRTEAAWTKLNSQATFLSAYTPTGSGLRRSKSTLYRLSVSGFSNRAEATSLCMRIRAVGGACFVRSAAGERPMQWTLRTGPGQPV